VSWRGEGRNTSNACTASTCGTINTCTSNTISTYVTLSASSTISTFCTHIAIGVNILHQDLFFPSPPPQKIEFFFPQTHKHYSLSHLPKFQLFPHLSVFLLTFCFPIPLIPFLLSFSSLFLPTSFLLPSFGHFSPPTIKFFIFILPLPGEGGDMKYLPL